MKTEVLGVPFDVISPQDALKQAIDYLNSDKAHTVFTPNPEIVMRARKDGEFMEILKQSDMVIPDGIGVVYASKLNKVKIKERVTGYDLIQGMLAHMKDTGHTVYFLGGAPNIPEQAKKNMEEVHQGLKVVSVHNGYFNEIEEMRIIKEIQTLKPDLILVCLGFPRQEKWIAKYKDILPAKVLIGAGGSIDGMSGNVKRAPKFFQKAGLEWFYRLIKQPSRIGRQMILPLFALVVIKEKIMDIFRKQS